MNQQENSKIQFRKQIFSEIFLMTNREIICWPLVGWVPMCTLHVLFWQAAMLFLLCFSSLSVQISWRQFLTMLIITQKNGIKTWKQWINLPHYAATDSNPSGSLQRKGIWHQRVVPFNKHYSNAIIMRLWFRIFIFTRQCEYHWAITHTISPRRNITNFGLKQQYH